MNSTSNSAVVEVEVDAGFGIYVLGSHEIRTVVHVPQSHREWDGHDCHLGLRSRLGGYAPVHVTVTGRKVRRVYAVGFDYRVTCTLAFADGSTANAELVFACAVELEEVRRLVQG